MDTKLPDEMPPQVTELPYGYGLQMDGRAMKIEWEPDVPNVRSLPLRHRHKLLEAYQCARDEYLRSVATVMGARILSVDTDGKITRTNVIAPATKQ